MIAKIFDALGRHIESQIEGSTRHIGYGRELHSYPAFSIIRPTTASYSSNIRHLSDGQKLYIIRCAIRGYTRTMYETALDDAEYLARQLELCISTFPRTFTLGSLVEQGVLSTQQGEDLETQDLFNIAIQRGATYMDDARVLSIETDEGLFAPLGICDLEIEMFYVEA